MERYNVTGMSCAACSSRVEKAVSKLDGVTQCNVNLLTNSMQVEGSAGAEAVIRAVREAGYDASLDNDTGDNTKKSGADIDKSSELKEANDAQIKALKTRFVSSVGFLMVLMYISMGHNMFGIPVPEILNDNPLGNALLQFILAVVVMMINQKFFINGFRGLIHKAPNMDTLVALGSAAACLYSTCVLFNMTLAVKSGEMETLHEMQHNLYYESAAMILALITLGKMLEARSKGKTTDAIRSLMKLAPKKATIIRNGIETVVDIEDVKKGDIFIVKPGESIAADGIVTEGMSAVDEAALTGESIPVDKKPGDKVCAATINSQGYLKCQATGVGEDTALARIIQLVNDASASKAPIAKTADKVSGIFVPVVMTIAAVTFGAWMIAGRDISFAIARAISVLVISCPCALGLATPVAIMVGSGRGAKLGIMFKTATALEITGRVKTVVLDKTGTITQGTPQITDIVPIENTETAVELLEVAYGLENKSEHPLARAVCKYALENNVKLSETKQFMAVSGNGVSGIINEVRVYGGNASYINEVTGINVLSGGTEVSEMAARLADEGKTPLYFATDKQLLGIIAVADVLRPDSAAAIDELKEMGIRVIMLTGDNERTANAIGEKAGVSEVVAGLLPEGKEKEVRRLKKNESVLMVGDGINDAPALTTADIGMAIGAGTDVAIEAADVVLVKNSITDVVNAIKLSRATLTNIHENLFWAFFYNIIGIPLAAGVWIPLFGWELNPMFGAAAMSLSSFCVVSNALRLNYVKLNRQKKVKTAGDEKNFHEFSCDTGNKVMIYDKINQLYKREEESYMTKTMVIEGMMCGHCEARVKKTLEKVDGVASAVADHKAGTAIVTLDKEIDDNLLKQVVEEQDYAVISIN